MTFDKQKYWKGRMIEKTQSHMNQMDVLFEEIKNNTIHIKGDLKPIQEQIDTIYNGFGELISRISKMKVQEGVDKHE